MQFATTFEALISKHPCTLFDHTGIKNAYHTSTKDHMNVQVADLQSAEEWLLLNNLHHGL